MTPKRSKSISKSKSKTKPKTKPKSKPKSKLGNATVEEGEWFEIRRILQERVFKGHVEYLVEWEDSAAGEVYPPTWSRDITSHAREEWEATKAAKSPKNPETVVPSTENSDSSAPRLANWRRLSKSGSSSLTRRRSLTSLAYDRPPKIQRTQPSSEEPVPSFVSASSPASPPGSPVLSSQEHPLHLGNTSIVVEISKDAAFDRFDYFSVTNSQSSGVSALSLAEVGGDDEIVVIPVGLSQGTVPDSQDFPALPGSQNRASDCHTFPSLPDKDTPQASQEDSPCLDTPGITIPDSVDRTASQQVADNKSQAVFSSHTNSLNQPPASIAAVSQIPESSIPSHQPNSHNVICDIGYQNLSSQAAGAITVPSLNNSTQEKSSSGHGSLYLTQPCFQAPFDVPQSSLDSQTPGSSCHSAVIATPTENSQTPAGKCFAEVEDSPQHEPTGTSSPGDEDLQAAQILVSHFHSLEQQFSGSLGRDLSPSEQRHSQTQDSETTASPQSKSNVHTSTRPLSSSPSQSLQPSAGPQLAPTRPLSEENCGPNPEMDGFNTSESRSNERVSAMEELSKLFDLDDDAAVESSSTLEAIAQPNSLLEIPGAHVPAPLPQLNAQEQQVAASMTLPVLNSSPPSTSLASKMWISSGPEAASEPVAPVSVINPMRESATQSLLDIVEMAFASPADVTPIQVETISLADITRQVEPVSKEMSLMPSITTDDPISSKLFESAESSLPLGQSQSETGSNDSPTMAPLNIVSEEHIITLPFQASLRPVYDETLLEYKGAITQFSRAFSGEHYVEPDAAVIDKINELLNRLYNICDYPPEVVGTVLEELPHAQQAKYCCDANAKFNFIFELLQGLRKETRVLIVARSVELLRLLCHLTAALELEFICKAIGILKSDFAGSSVRVVLVLSTENEDISPFDIVIGFDHAFSRSPIVHSLSSRSLNPTLVLVLVTTHSLEHISLQIPDDLSQMEGQNALLSGIVRSRKLVSDPDRAEFHEPHEVAAIFFEYLNDHENTIMWEPVPIPDGVLDIFVNSQAHSQLHIDALQQHDKGLKRKLDEGDDFHVKRKRIFSWSSDGIPSEPPLPDEVRDLLGSLKQAEAPARPEVLITVPLSSLEALAANQNELQRQLEATNVTTESQAVISSLEKRIKEYERTERKIYTIYRAALQDRSRFEAEKCKIEETMQTVSDSANREAEKAHKRILELENTVKRLTEDPNVANGETTPLAKTEKLFQEAQQKVTILEKRLENAHKDEAYVRNLYQDASTVAGAMKSENNQLKAQNESLLKKSDEGFVQVHRMQEDSNTREYVRQIAELKADMKEKDAELDRARDELRLLKNGRRETRQASVPRSPRMGMMSPRTGRAYGGSTSRGTSPAPAVEGAGMQYLGQQAGNGRWNHLRD